MDTNTRTDIHRPSAIVPADYEYVAIWTMNITGFGDAEFMLRERAIAKAHRERTGGDITHKSHGSCGICGNQLAIYLALFYHAKSNEYIVVGVNCAQKLDLGMDFKAMEQFKRRCADAREQQAGKRKAIALLGDWGLIDAWEVADATFPVHADTCKAAGRNEHGDDNGIDNPCTCDREAQIKIWNSFPESTIRDMVSKLIRWGSVSDKQKDFMRNLLKQIADRPIVEAERKAEKDAAGPVPVGRTLMTGVVVGTKEVAAPQFGYSRYSNGPDTVIKLIIKLENGSKVYGSRFANASKGDSVKFTATVEASKDDPKFGFYKRPVVFVEKRELSKDEKKQVRRLKGVQRGVNAWAKPDHEAHTYAFGYTEAYDAVYQAIKAVENGNQEVVA